MRTPLISQSSFSVLIGFILSYHSDDFYADAKQINTNEISHKSTRFNSFNYCEPGLCSSNKKHVACGNKGKFGHSCTEDARVIELDDFHKRLILYMHNVHRNTIAMGKTPGFEPASRMGALQWDNGELRIKNIKKIIFNLLIMNRTRIFGRT